MSNFMDYLNATGLVNKIKTMLDKKQVTIQFSTMPTASAEYEGQIVQFIGTTDNNYTNGYWYKCEEITPSTTPKTYHWVRVTHEVDNDTLHEDANGVMSVDGKYKKIWEGTHAEWDLLSTAEKTAYDVAHFTDDAPTAEIVGYQKKTLDTPLTIDGTQQTTVEGALGGLNDEVTAENSEISDIVNVYGSKNLIPYPYHETTTVKSGITYTDNGDGTVTVNGTATANSSFNMNYPTVTETLIKLDKNKRYIYSDVTKLSGESGTVLGIRYYAEGVTPSTSNGTNVALQASNNWEVEITNAVSAYVYVYVAKNNVVNNVTFKPMLRLASIADDTYVPYTPTNRQLLSHKDNGILGAKNLLPNNAVTEVKNGVTYTVRADGSINANGTASADTWYEVSLLQKVTKTMTLVLNGCPQGGTTSTYILQLADRGTDNTTDVTIHKDLGNGITFTLEANHYYRVHILIRSGITLNNLVFYPMLRLASDSDNTYQPYAKTNKELTEALSVQIGNTIPMRAISEKITLSFLNHSRYGNLVVCSGIVNVIDSLDAAEAMFYLNEKPGITTYPCFIFEDNTPKRFSFRDSGRIDCSTALTAGQKFYFYLTFIVYEEI